jgi:hypothetical protein
MANMKLIEAKTVGAGGIATIQFTTIPQTYTDLVVKLSVRGANSQEAGDFLLSLNGSTSNFSMRRLFTVGATVYSDTGDGNFNKVGQFPANSQTANTFSNAEIYITNYASANTKVISGDTVSATNGVNTLIFIGQVVWSNSAAITSLTLSSNGGNFIENSTAYLYGIESASLGAKATGGLIYSDNDYFYHTFFSSGTFAPSTSLTCDVLVVAGGGGTGSTSVGTSGTASSFGSISASGGGRGGTGGSVPSSGGSGGGAHRTDGPAGSGNAGSYSPVEGFAGALGDGTGGSNGGGGGGAGGTGSVGGNGIGGNGGTGSNIYNSINFTQWLITTGTGINGLIAGGGGGGGDTVGGTTNGGGGIGGRTGSTTGGNAIINTGGGGGGGGQAGGTLGGNGAAGLIIVRYEK